MAYGGKVLQGLFFCLALQFSHGELSRVPKVALYHIPNSSSLQQRTIAKNRAGCPASLGGVSINILGVSLQWDLAFDGPQGCALVAARGRDSVVQIAHPLSRFSSSIP
jgi:hypothetical protein